MSETIFPCLEARILGGAFVHEGWGDISCARLVALFDSDWNASLFAKMMAAAEKPDSTRHWIVTDSRGGAQQRWNRRRIDSEKAKSA